MTNVNMAILECIRRQRWLCQLDAATQRHIASGAQRFTFSQGERIFNEGDDLRYSLLLEHGSLEIYRNTRQGEEKVFQILGPGQWVTLAALFMDHGRFPMNARAHTDGDGVRIPHALLQELCLRQPALTLSFLQHFCNQLYSTLNQIDWLTSSSAAERLAAWLVDFSHNGEQRQLALPLSQAQLAARLGMRSETLCRLLSQWRKQHIVSGVGNRLQLEDLAYLQQLSQGARRQF